MNLSKEQKEQILEKFKERQDLNWITQEVFNDPSLKGTHKEGRAVRAFLAEQGRQYNTTKSEKKTNVVLSEEQMELLSGDRVGPDMNTLEITKLTFQDDSIKPLSAEHRAVQTFLYANRKDIVDESELAADTRWMRPQSMLTAIERVNKWTGENMPRDPDKLPLKKRRCLTSLLSYYTSYKLQQEIETYKTKADRELYESEFVRSVWDKDDLTSDELNLYMLVCSNYVKRSKIQKRLDAFNQMLDAEDLSTGDLTMRLTEHLKATSDELDKCEKMINTLINKLNGDRAKRLEKKGANSTNFLAIVELWQEEEERLRMVQMAEMQNKLVEEEADLLESVDELKARVFGIGKREIV